MDFICFVRLQCSKFNNNNIIFMILQSYYWTTMYDSLKRTDSQERFVHTPDVATSLMNVPRRVTLTFKNQNQRWRLNKQNISLLFSFLIAWNGSFFEACPAKWRCYDSVGQSAALEDCLLWVTWKWPKACVNYTWIKDLF